jgi:RES domain
VGKIPRPPKDFATRKLQIKNVDPSALMAIRRNRPKAPHINFRATGYNRFDDPDRTYGTIYVADTLEACFAETVLRKGLKRTPLRRGRTFIPEPEIDTRRVVHLKSAIPGGKLRLAVFKGAAMANLGADGSVSSSPSYTTAQLWSQAFYAHPEDIDGFIYAPRHLNDKEAIVIFERAKPELAVAKVVPLESHPEIGRTLDLFDISI